MGWTETGVIVAILALIATIFGIMYSIYRSAVADRKAAILAGGENIELIQKELKKRRMKLKDHCLSVSFILPPLSEERF